MYYKVARQIYKELSVKHDLPIGTIEDICRAPLELFDWITKNKIDKEALIYPSLRISGFGVFYVSQEKLKRRIIRLKNGKNNNTLQSGSIQSPDEPDA